MPTIADILAGIDSVVTPAKRRLADMIRNPLASAQQTVGLLGDRAQEFDRDIGLGVDRRALQNAGSVMANAPQYVDADRRTVDRMNSLIGSFAPIGLTVYHGSPHKFDRFDSSKIGTGEGAQAYGHGLYLAENPGTAEFYKKTLTDSKINIDGKPYYQVAKSDDVKNLILESGGDINKAIGMANDLLDHFTKVSPSFSNRRKAQEALQELQNLQRNSVVEKNVGHLYKADLPDDQIAKMLDWDKPLSQQAPEVQNAAAALFAKMDPDARKLVGNSLGELKGKKLYELMSSDDSVAGVGAYGAAASSAMRAAGIPGIRYLDGGSRGAGTGTQNFVVFPGNEGLLKILERNGEPVK